MGIKRLYKKIEMIQEPESILKKFSANHVFLDSPYAAQVLKYAAQCLEDWHSKQGKNELY